MNRSDLNGKHGRLRISACTILLLLAIGCTVSKPTAPTPDSLAGRWTGSFSKAGESSSASAQLLLIVRSDGIAMGTGYAFYTVESQPWVERLTLDLIVEPDGTVAGMATWTLEVFWYGAGSATGEVSGNLISREKRGEGEISFNIGGEIVRKDWTLIKVDE